MLKISEIRDLVRRHPAPSDIADMRDAVTKAFCQLEFVEEGHRYYLPRTNGEKEELTSVSGLISKFEQPADWDKISLNYAKKRGLDVEDVRRSWKETNVTALSRGTKTHHFGEMLMHLILGDEDVARQNLPFQIADDYIIPYCPKEEAILKYWTDLLSTGRVWPIMPETKVYTGVNDKCNFLFNYAGTFDILLGMETGGEIKVALHDYKGLPLDTPIATTRGWTTMGEIAVGDEVFDKDGFSAPVMHASRVHLNPCYRITFDDGLSIVADMEHRWLINVGLGGGYEAERVVTTQELVLLMNSPIGGAPRILGHKPIGQQHASSLGLGDTSSIDRTVTLVKPVDTVPTRCIEVKSSSHTFCCGKEMLVTHNTNASLTNEYCQSCGKMMLPPFDDMIDEAISHYNIQLSAYQIPLEAIGLNVIDRRVIWLKDDGTYEKVRVPDVTNRIQSVLVDPDSVGYLRSGSHKHC